MPYDVRAVANEILRLADERGCGISNLALNKIVYFIHAAYLHRTQKALVSAKIEAWQHGPVFRELYHQFKKYGRDPIAGRATRLDAASGGSVEVTDRLAPSDTAFVRAHADELMKLSPGKLVDMSHLTDGPWYRARFGGGPVNPGVEITSELILAAATTQMRH